MATLTPIEAIRSAARWDVLIVFALMAALTLFELIGVFGQHFITITAILKAYLPIPVRVMILAWLVWHFFISDITGVPAR